jgi:hypothetical protein
MANCKLWMDLSLQEKIIMIGKTTHLMQNDATGFEAIERILKNAEMKGIFDEVIINPSSDEKQNY